MITSVHYQPHFYSTAYNPIVWSFSSDKASELNFSYVVDVYVNAATGATAGYYRIKQKPNQLGACMVDVSSIVQGYVDLTLYSAEEGWPLPFRNTSEIAPSVFIKVGEEYGYPQSNLVIYNGYGATGAPAYPIYSLDAPGYPVVALPAALEYQDALDSMSATGGFGYFTDHIMGTGGTGVNVPDLIAQNGMTGDGLFLTRVPFDTSGVKRLRTTLTDATPISRQINVRRTDHHTLSFLNWNIKTPQAQRGPVGFIRMNATGASGNNLNNYPNLISFGGGPRTSAATGATGIYPWSQPYSMITAKVGPADFPVGCYGFKLTARTNQPVTVTYTDCYGATGQTLTVPGGSGNFVNFCGRLCRYELPYTDFLFRNPSSNSFSTLAIDDSYYCGATGGCWDQIEYYDVCLTSPFTLPPGSSPPGTFFSNLVSEVIRFNLVDDNCQDLYPAVRLSWLNDLGGRDYYTFDMFYEKVSTSTGLEYQQVPLNWNAYTPVVTTGNPNTNTAPNWQRGGGKSFNKVTGRRFSIQSDWLTQQYVDYLAGIAQSPSVWAYVGDEPIPYTVVVTNTEYTYKTVKQTKMVQVTFDCQLTKVQPRQNY